MAEPFDTLMQVQDLDIAIDQLHRRKETIPERAALAGIEAERADLLASVADVHAQVQDLQKRQDGLEEQIATSAKRRTSLEERMLRGEVTDPRDLQAVDGEVHHLADRESHLEDEELEILEELEPLEGRLAEAEAAAADFEEQAQQLREAIAEAVQTIDTELQAEQARRREVATSLPAELAERYEALRARLGGVGAARLVGDRCDGCHLTLPSVEVERIRNLPPDQFATCDQCGRILVH